MDDCQVALIFNLVGKRLHVHFFFLIDRRGVELRAVARILEIFIVARDALKILVGKPVAHGVIVLQGIGPHPAGRDFDLVIRRKHHCRTRTAAATVLERRAVSLELKNLARPVGVGLREIIEVVELPGARNRAVGAGLRQLVFVACLNIVAHVGSQIGKVREQIVGQFIDAGSFSLEPAEAVNRL